MMEGASYLGGVAVKLRVKACTGCFGERVTLIGPSSVISFMIRRSGINCLVAMLSAMYSASVVERAISDCNLLDQVTGQPQWVIRKPV